MKWFARRTVQKKSDPVKDGGTAYRPLNESTDEIRLISVHPLEAGETRNNLIRCSMKYVSLAAYRTSTSRSAQ